MALNPPPGPVVTWEASVSIFVRLWSFCGDTNHQDRNQDPFVRVQSEAEGSESDLSWTQTTRHFSCFYLLPVVNCFSLSIGLKKQQQQKNKQTFWTKCFDSWKKANVLTVVFFFRWAPGSTSCWLLPCLEPWVGFWCLMLDARKKRKNTKIQSFCKYNLLSCGPLGHMTM